MQHFAPHLPPPPSSNSISGFQFRPCSLDNIIHIHSFVNYYLYSLYSVIVMFPFSMICINTCYRFKKFCLNWQSLITARNVWVVSNTHEVGWYFCRKFNFFGSIPHMSALIFISFGKSFRTKISLIYIEEKLNKKITNKRKEKFSVARYA